MPRSKHRDRVCQNCGKTYTLGQESSQHKYCSLKCRNEWHYNRWKSSGGKRCKTKIHNYWLQHKYGISLEQKETLFKNQNYTCAICKTDTPTKYGWHIDHCHKTQKVRGILCQFCNQLLGMAKDNPLILKEAINYLHEHSETDVDNSKRGADDWGHGTSVSP